MKRLSPLSLLAGLLLAGGSAQAGPILLNTETYSQDFSSFGTSGTQTLPEGWTHGNSNSASTGFNMALGAGTSANTSNGTSTNGVYNISTNNNPDRALASMSGGNAFKTIDVAFTNGLGSDISGFELSYDAELYYIRPSTASDARTMYISTTGATGSWTALPADFNVSLTVTPPAATVAQDGNLPANKQTISASYNFATPIQPGQSFYLRWWDVDGLQSTGTPGANGSTNMLIGIDNVDLTVTQVPEPASIGLIGLGSLALLRRRR